MDVSAALLITGLTTAFTLGGSWYLNKATLNGTKEKTNKNSKDIEIIKTQNAEQDTKLAVLETQYCNIEHGINEIKETLNRR